MRKIGLVAAIALVAAIGAAGATRSQTTTPPGWPADRVEVIRFERPPAWSVQRFGNYCMRDGPGELLSNVKHTFEHPVIKDGCTNAWKVAGLPSGYVLVDISAFEFPVGAWGDTSLPLSLNGFPGGHAADCRCTFKSWALKTAEGAFEIRVWIGDKADTADRRAVAAIIASIRQR